MSERRETTNCTTEQGCNLGLAVICVLSGPLFKIRVPKIKAAAFPGSFSSSSEQCEECIGWGDKPGSKGGMTGAARGRDLPCPVYACW